MSINLAYQTIIWGNNIALSDSLRSIGSAGFSGVELAQDPGLLIRQRQIGSLTDLVRLAAECGLRILGFAGGSLRERMEFVSEARDSYYLYIDKWDAESERALRQGFILAAHVHAFMSLRSTDQVFSLLESNRHSNLKWIPDTGHLAVLNEDVNRIVSMHRQRIASIHLKDWTPVYGRSAHRYARGFTDLGAGIANIPQLLKSLQASKYEGWVVVEQDYSVDGPLKAMERSADFLRECGVMKRPRRITPHTNTVDFGSLDASPKGAVLLRDKLATASRQPTERAFREIAREIADISCSDLVSIWASSPSHDLLTLMGLHPDLKLTIQSMRTSECLCGLALDHQYPTTFDLTEEYPANRFSRPDLRFNTDDALATMELKHMTSVPVFSPYNRHYVRWVVNIFHKSHQRPSRMDELLQVISDAVAPIGDALLDRECSDAIAHASFLAGAFGTLATFPDEIAKLIKAKTAAEGVSLFWQNETHDAIRVIGTTGIDWFVDRPDQIYSLGEGLTGAVWATGQSMASNNALKEPGRSGKSAEKIDGIAHSCLWEPIFSRPKSVLGVVRCQNKRVESLGGYNMFSDQDSAVIEAIMMVTVPHIELLLADERRRSTTARLAHELLSPITAIRGAAQLMKVELGATGQTKRFAFDYLSDVECWADLMTGLVENASAFGGFGERGQVPINLGYTRLMADVIAPAVRQVGILLKSRSFSRSRISYSRLDAIPPLWIDRHRFQQVIFNLLSNAIKFALLDPKAFNVIIDGRREEGEFVLTVRDWGEGIVKGYSEEIFLEGFRPPRSSGPTVTGQGLGLWIVRSIVEAHGGRVAVTGFGQPTEFSIYLPEDLQRLQRQSTR